MAERDIASRIVVTGKKNDSMYLECDYFVPPAPSDTWTSQHLNAKQ